MNNYQIKMTKPSDHLIYIPEIEQYILDYLDPIRDGKNIILINKHFYDLMIINPVRTEFKEFFSKEKSLYIVHNSTPQSKTQELFFKACRYNYSNVVKYFLKWYDDDTEFFLCFRKNSSFNICCENGFIEIGKNLIDLDTQGMIKIRKRKEEFFKSACIFNNLEFAKWFYRLCLENKNYGKINIRAGNDIIFKLSCSNGHVEVLRWLCELSSDREVRTVPFVLSDFDPKSMFKNKEFLEACENNQLQILKYLYSLDNKINNELLIVLFKTSCKLGYLEMAQWLYSISIESGNQINFTILKSAFQQACIRNHKKVAKWFASLSENYRFEIVNDRINRFWF